MSEDNTPSLSEEVQSVINPVKVIADHFEPDPDVEISEEV
jgi:hypothetical protein